MHKIALVAKQWRVGLTKRGLHKDKRGLLGGEVWTVKKGSMTSFGTSYRGLETIAAQRQRWGPQMPKKEWKWMNRRAM